MTDAQSSFISTDQLLEHLKWRYAVKKFDPSKQISETDWLALEQSLILSPSSFGLQPWKFFVVDTPETRQSLLEFSWGQAQVLEASHLVVLATRLTIDAEYVDDYVAYTAKVRGMAVEDLAKFGQVIKDFVARMSPAELQVWAKLQVYIALGQLMTSAAHLGIDTCPMEGFVPAKYDEVLGLEEKGYAAAVVCTLGYRDSADPYASYPKVRFGREAMIETL